MSTKPLRSLRLLGREATNLTRSPGLTGEIFYDTTNQTLRLFDNQSSSSILATRSWVLDNSSNFSGNYTDLTNKPTLFSGNYTDLINKPTLFSGSYSDLTNKPTDFTNLTGLSFSQGVAVNEFSNDPLFTDNSTQSVPTENAIRLYIDRRLGLTHNGEVVPPADKIGPGFATETYVDTAVSNLIDTAPTALNTLNELAAALNDDANFATTVTTALSGKESTITAGTTAQYWRGDKSWQTLNATAVGLGNVTNESKATMFSSPTFTGTVSGITATMVGLGNVTNESKATMFSSPTFTGVTTLEETTEVLSTISGATGTVAHDFTTGAIWYHSGISANFTANFTNVPTTNNRTIVCTLILVQGATAYIPNAVQIGGSAQTIKWLGSASAPTGNANKVDVVSFTLIRTGSVWAQVLGSLTSFG